MKYVVKILVIILLILTITNIFSIYKNKSIAMTDITENPDSWEPSEEDVDSWRFDRIVSRVTGTIKLIGIIISVITLSIIGIKFMLGSVEEKAQYKQTLVPWIVGACMLFAMTLIPDMIYQIVRDPYQATTNVGNEYYKGYLSGYTDGIDFCRNWDGKSESLEKKRNQYMNYIRNNAETSGRADGALDALSQAGNTGFCSGYFRADSWVQGKTKEEIQEQNSKVSSGTGGIPTTEIAGYCQRLSLQLNIID